MSLHSRPDKELMMIPDEDEQEQEKQNVNIYIKKTPLVDLAIELVGAR